LLTAAREQPVSYAYSIRTRGGLPSLTTPRGYTLDHTRSEIGAGSEAFARAKAAMRQWQHFDLGWVRVANPSAEISVDALVAVEAHALGQWSVNLSRILYVIDEPFRFGYGYGTTPIHIERGEERFLLEYDPDSQTVSYDLLAVSQPAHWMVRLAFPYTRGQQRRFAMESHRRMASLAF
jgi:uncharacterized protein (UPF0548 family)